MKYYLLLACVQLCISCKDSNQQKPLESSSMENTKYKTVGSVERMDPALDQWIDQGAQIEVLAEGYQWTEGPVWIEDGQYLLYSEIPSNSIYKWSEASGASLFINPSGYTGEEERGGEPGSNGLILDAQGRLVLCQHGDRRMARLTSNLDKPESKFETIIDNYEGKRFNSPNDAVYDSKGNLYFTDPPYGLEGYVTDPTKEIDFQGVYRYSPDGKLTLLTDQLTRPNGLAFSPDEQILYVANSDPDKAIWMAYTLHENGGIAEEKLFYDATGMNGKGLPDGMKINDEGIIFATGPGGIFVFQPDGTLLGKINSGEATSNCAFDTEQKTLYMTCDDFLMRIKLKA